MQWETLTLSIENTGGGFYRIFAFVLYKRGMLAAPDRGWLRC